MGGFLNLRTLVPRDHDVCHVVKKLLWLRIRNMIILSKRAEDNTQFTTRRMHQEVSNVKKANIIKIHTYCRFQ